MSQRYKSKPCGYRGFFFKKGFYKIYVIDEIIECVVLGIVHGLAAVHLEAEGALLLELTIILEKMG